MEQTIQLLNSIGQEHLVQDVDKFSEAEQTAFVRQVESLNKSYPGGLAAYVKNAKALLKASKDEVNPFEGFSPKIPSEKKISLDNLSRLRELEAVGLEEIRLTCFVLVAGGLGERLGYEGIKIGIPTELVTKACFLELYFSFVSAYEQRLGTTIPFAIMTSDDTNVPTLQLLEEKQYFGLTKAQVSIIKQDKVCAMVDNSARFQRTEG